MEGADAYKVRACAFKCHIASDYLFNVTAGDYFFNRFARDHAFLLP